MLVLQKSYLVSASQSSEKVQKVFMPLEWQSYLDIRSKTGSSDEPPARRDPGRVGGHLAGVRPETKQS